MQNLFLSWNTARFLALILNALTGLNQFFERDSKFLDADSIFALRVVQGHLDELHDAFENRGLHPTIFSAIKTISKNAEKNSIKALNYLNNDTKIKILKKLLNKKQKLGLNLHKKIDPNLRWLKKNLLSRDEIQKTENWFQFNNSTFSRCITSIAKDICNDEKLFTKCFRLILLPKGYIGYDLSRQIFFLSLLQKLNCSKKIESNLQYKVKIEHLKTYKTTLNFTNNYIEERCTNMYDELMIFRDKKKLARIINPSLNLLLEQVFVCLQYGYVEFVNPHFLITALAWQHPTLGCYTNYKPETIPNMGLSADFQKSDNFYNNQSDIRATCFTHTSSVAAVVLVVYLRFLIDPGPWYEYYFADHIVQIDSIIAEERFQQFKYIDWVQDSNLYMIHGSQKVLIKPPPTSMSADLIAFVFLFFVFFVGSILAHYLFTQDKSDLKIGGKRFYPYAFKKL